MLKFKISIILLFIGSILSSLPIRFSESIIDFGNTYSQQTYQKVFYIINESDQVQNITINHEVQTFTVNPSNTSIPANDSIQVVISFQAPHNINYSDVLFFNNSIHQTESVLKIKASNRYQGDLYQSTNNLWDTALKNALLSLIDNHNSLGYDGARQAMFYSIDNVNGWVECVYTGQLVQTNGIPDVNTQHMNTEHTWPQSLGAEGVAKSDLYHLYPTNDTANSVRGNLPFGVVVSGQNWSVGGSKRGNNSTGTLVFEPRDVHKGDVARAMFYFCVRYDNPSAPFFNNQEQVLRTWHLSDPVSIKETNRNNAIELLQNNRNPFVDHPEFVERIYSLSTNQNRPQAPDLMVNQNQINTYNENEIIIPFTNTGNSVLNIQNVLSSNSQYVIEEFTSSIAPFEIGIIRVVVPQNQNGVSTQLSINSNGGNQNIQITSYYSLDTEVSEAEILNQAVIYPNPVRDNMKISFKQDMRMNNVKIDLFNIKGQKIRNDQYSVEHQDHVFVVKFDKVSMNSGIYFVKIIRDDHIQINKILIIK